MCFRTFASAFRVLSPFRIGRPDQSSVLTPGWQLHRCRMPLYTVSFFPRRAIYAAHHALFFSPRCVVCHFARCLFFAAAARHIALYRRYRRNITVIHHHVPWRVPLSLCHVRAQRRRGVPRRGAFQRTRLLLLPAASTPPPALTPANTNAAALARVLAPPCMLAPRCT